MNRLRGIESMATHFGINRWSFDRLKAKGAFPSIRVINSKLLLADSEELERDLKWWNKFKSPRPEGKFLK